MTLTWRLFSSYFIVVVVSLTLAFATLVLVSRPIQNRLIRTRLSIEARQAAARLNVLYRQGAATAAVVEQFQAAVTENDPHLVLLNLQGQVLADSKGDWTGQQLPVPTTAEAQTKLRPEVENFTAASGESFFYALLPIGPQNNPAGFVAAVAASPTGLPAVLSELGWGFLAAGIVALAVSLLAGVLIARSIAGPLQRIATAAAAVAAGDYEHRLPENGPPELKRVAGSFNVMIERVEDSQRAMRDFVSNVSHELKTPLTSIQGFSQALMEGATHDEASRRRAAGIIHQEAARMTRMVEDLLDLARIDSGQIVMAQTPLDLTSILSSTVERLLPQAAHKQIQFVKSWDSLPPVNGDGDRLAQVFTNLLDNAIKHTPAGGRITVTSAVAQGLPRPRRVRAGLVQPDATTSLSERGNFASISIADTGPGIPPDDLARIFERFYQVDKSRQRGKGTGLGLAITKEIVEAHGGYVRAESVEGIGTKFTVLLPFTQTDAATLVTPRR